MVTQINVLDEYFPLEADTFRGYDCLVMPMDKNEPRKVASQATVILGTILTVLTIVGLAVGCTVWVNARFSEVEKRLGKSEDAIKALGSEQSDKTNTLIKELLAQANSTIRTGKPELTERAVQAASVFIDSQKDQKVQSPPSFFRDTAISLLAVRQTSPNFAVSDNISQALVKLAEYRSASNSSAKESAFDVVRSGPEIIKIKPPYSLNPGFLVIRGLLKNGTQTLDGIRWRNTSFENMHIIYLGGDMELSNVKFINCTFEIRTNSPKTDQFLLYAALNGDLKSVG
jgi:hypothetical protein